VQLTGYPTASPEFGSPTRLAAVVFSLSLAATLTVASVALARQDATTH